MKTENGIDPRCRFFVRTDPDGGLRKNGKGCMLEIF